MEINDCPGNPAEFDPTGLFKVILVPIDFTPASRQAIIAACEMRRKYGSELHVFRLSKFGENDDFIRGLGAPWSEGDVKDETRNQLRMFGESICLGTPCLHYETLMGEDVVEGIAKAARDCKATLVLLPIHEGKTLLRSKTEKVARALDVPVLLIKERVGAEVAG